MKPPRHRGSDRRSSRKPPAGAKRNARPSRSRGAGGEDKRAGRAENKQAAASGGHRSQRSVPQGEGAKQRKFRSGRTTEARPDFRKRRSERMAHASESKPGYRGDRKRDRRPDPAERPRPPPRERRTVHRKLPPRPGAGATDGEVGVKGRKDVAPDQPPPPAPSTDLGLLEQRLGHSFADSRLLRRALTHSSAGADNYERLEFLGDAAVGFVIARLLFKDLPDAAEQRLTLMRSHLVSTAALAEVAGELQLGRFLVLGTGERRAGGAERPSILADALEAVLGAVLCDGGLNTATKCVRRLFANRLAAAQGMELKDPKTRLQEHLQQHGLALPRYEITAAGGLDHAPVYAVECVVEALGVRAKGVAGNRREAEKHAAAQALVDIETATGSRSGAASRASASMA